MRKNGFVLFLIFIILFGGFSSASASPPAKIVSGFIFNALAPLLKWLWSLISTTRTAISGSPKMKFEGGYTVETVFDGSKLGIEPYTVEVLSNGELLVLDSANSNIYKISQPLSRYSRPKLVAGSSWGYSGHVDGKLREARMNHPKSLTVDDKGSIYIADTMNMVIRKISDAGVTTIAGGNWGRGGGHVDGPSEDAKFSTDFDVVYIRSSCSLLVIDRGNQAIREIQLQSDDCAYQYGAGFSLGFVVVVAAVLFGYMLGNLQRRVGTMVSSQDKPLKSSLKPPLIPTGEEHDSQEEGVFCSLGRLFLNVGESVAEIVGGSLGYKKKSLNAQQTKHQYQNQQSRSNTWPLQESFVIPDEDEPPSIETRTPTPRKTYAFMAKNPEKTHHVRQSPPYYNGWDGNTHQKKHQQQQQQQQQQQHYQLRNYSPGPQTYCEQSSESTKEIVFGAVQEQDGECEAVVMKSVHYGAPVYDYQNIRSRTSYSDYVRDY